jgi:hypothetical protein
MSKMVQNACMSSSIKKKIAKGALICVLIAIGAKKLSPKIRRTLYGQRSKSLSLNENESDNAKRSRASLNKEFYRQLQIANSIICLIVKVKIVSMVN